MTESSYALRLARETLAEARQHCRYHGTDFTKLGTEPHEVGLPRCDSCKQPWRVRRALAAIDRALAPKSAAPEVHVVDVTAGTPAAAWCEECLTSAGLTIPIVAADESGVSVLDTATGCTECRTGVFAPPTVEP